MILSLYIDFTHVAASSQQLMTSQIRSHIEYLIWTYNILVLILYSKLMRIVVALAVFNTIWFLIVVYFFWATLYSHDATNVAVDCLQMREEATGSALQTSMTIINTH